MRRTGQREERAVSSCLRGHARQIVSSPPLRLSSQRRIVDGVSRSKAPKSTEARRKVQDIEFTSAMRPSVRPARLTIVIAMGSVLAGMTTGAIGTSYAAETPTKPAAAATENPSETCAHRYHARLRQDSLPLAITTQTIADELRQVSDDLPGQWLFWDGSNILARTAYQRRLLATPQHDLQTNRLCTNQILARGGRIRCLKWEPIPAGYEPPDPDAPLPEARAPKISAAEFRTASSLASLVIHKGSLQEFARDTALYHLVQRSTDELTKYTDQPYRPTICSGALEMITFYRRQLNPVFGKAERARELYAEIQATSESALRQALKIRSVKQTSDPAPPWSSTAEPEKIASDLDALLVGLLTEPEQQRWQRTATEGASLRLVLQKGRDFLTSQAIDALPEAEAESIKKALRNAEFRVYAAHYSNQLARLKGIFHAVLEKIENNHRETCTCNVD